VTQLLLEQLSISMEEGQVARWLVEDGAPVRKGEPVVEIETDKSTVEVEAPGDGTLQIRVAAGETVPVDTVLAEIVTPADARGTGGPQPEAAVSVDDDDVVPPAETRDAAAARPEAEPSVDRDERRPVAASPAARRLARELGVDLSSLTGSHPGGRIVAADVERAAAGRVVPQEAREAPGLRELVLRSITQSWQTIPHIHIVGELEADGLEQAKRLAPAGTTVTDLLVVAVARALRDVPDLNGFVDGHAAPRRTEAVHLALAVATAGGVVAPVIRDAATLSLAQVAAERARLVGAARAGTLEKRDLGGATCTLSNLGAYPVDVFAPVISSPQIALVATGRLAQKPVAVDGMIAVRNRISVNAAIDHRGADGEAGGRFLAALERRFAELPASI
jgi:pyruvate dehydrogenase E2 component (dihydrolipoamide acetyltransferase)